MLGVVAKHIKRVDVPGALEVPLALKVMADSDEFDALVALGCVIRGETYHFELVANESGAGVTRVALDHQVPVANAILTVENEAQAWARAEDKGATRHAWRSRWRICSRTCERDLDESRRPAKSQRRRSRELALQGLYQWLIAGGDADTIDAQLREHEGYAKCDSVHFDALLRGSIEQAAVLDAALARHVDRKTTELSPVEHGVLMIGAYELTHCLDIPYKVAINEAVELAKSFGGTDGHKYVNGVLDKVAADLRPAEVQAARERARMKTAVAARPHRAFLRDGVRQGRRRDRARPAVRSGAGRPADDLPQHRRARFHRRAAGRRSRNALHGRRPHAVHAGHRPVRAARRHRALVRAALRPGHRAPNASSSPRARRRRCN